MEEKKESKYVLDKNSIEFLIDLRVMYASTYNNYLGRLPVLSKLSPYVIFLIKNFTPEKTGICVMIYKNELKDDTNEFGLVKPCVFDIIKQKDILEWKTFIHELGPFQMLGVEKFSFRNVKNRPEFYSLFTQLTELINPTLILNLNKIDFADVNFDEFLADSRVDPMILQLDDIFSDNGVDDSVINYIKNHKNLLGINIGDMFIREFGLIKICKSLIGNTTLKCFCIGGTRYAHRTVAEALVEAARGSKLLSIKYYSGIMHAELRQTIENLLQIPVEERLISDSLQEKKTEL